MNYEEKVSTRAQVRELYERVIKNPAIARYRGYTANNSYGWNAAAGDYFKREGEVWYENPNYDPNYAEETEKDVDLLWEEHKECERCIEQLNAEKSELCALIDTLNARIGAYEAQLTCVTEERDEALRALAALREALAAIRKLTEI